VSLRTEAASRAACRSIATEREALAANADRWEYFADGAKRETSSNGDNAFVRYVGEWVVAEAHRDPEDGDYLTPRTADDWIDAVRANEGEEDCHG
jgi:hypothetical protein